MLIAPRAGTNPTWWKRVEEEDRLDPGREEIVTQFQASATELAAGLHRDNYDGGVDVHVGLGHSRRLELDDGTVDAVVGRLLYCTRIDYGVATRPELAVLGAGEQDIKLLRSRMTGDLCERGLDSQDVRAIAPRDSEADGLQDRVARRDRRVVEQDHSRLGAHPRHVGIGAEALRLGEELERGARTRSAYTFSTRASVIAP